MSSLVKNEQGFVITVMSFAIVAIIGLFLMYYGNSSSFGVVRAGNDFSNSQANWSAMAGIEYAISDLINGQFNFVGSHSFGNSSIILDTLTTDTINKSLQVTSTGTYGDSKRIFEITFNPTSSDTLLSEDFDNDDGFGYAPEGAGPGNGRFWGMTCGDQDAPGYLPQYVLTGADGCYFFGSKIRASSLLTIDQILADVDENYILTISIAAGVDVPNPDEQSAFQTGDFLQIIVNGNLIERWEGTSAVGGNPMTPRLGNTSQSLTPVFNEISFNITNIMGSLSDARIEFQAKTNSSNKYIGIEGLSMYGSGGYSIVMGSYKKK